jgi:hypothetical protein
MIDRLLIGMVPPGILFGLKSVFPESLTGLEEAAL